MEDRVDVGLRVRPHDVTEVWDGISTCGQLYDEMPVSAARRR
jgi:hypothetical protein